MIERLGNLLCDIARWVAIIHKRQQDRHFVRDYDEAQWLKAIAAVRRMTTEDTDHITIVRNRHR
ncbi:hypothetical protein [Gordonia terrae]